MPPKSRTFSAPGASLASQHHGQLLRQPSSGGSLAFSQKDFLGSSVGVAADKAGWCGAPCCCAPRKKAKQHSAYLFQHSAVSIVGNIAEGKLNFTSTSAPSKDDVSGIESDAEYEVEKDIEREASRGQNDDDLQMMDGANPAQSMAQVQRQEINGKKIDGGSRKRPKNSPKKRNADGLVQVIERLVHIKEKEANKEAAHDFSISKCMDALKTLEGVSAGDKILALEVFKDGDNHEIFVNLVADKDGTAIAWLRAQIAKLK